MSTTITISFSFSISKNKDAMVIVVEGFGEHSLSSLRTRPSDDTLGTQQKLILSFGRY